MNILCIFSHDWRSLNNKQRRCARPGCKALYVKDYWGNWVAYKPKVTELYPVKMKGTKPCQH